MENSSCPKFLGVLGFLTDCRLIIAIIAPESGPDIHFDKKLYSWKIAAILFVAVWTISAVTALVYTCVPGLKFRYWITISHLMIGVIGAILQVVAIWVIPLPDSYVTSSLVIILSVRLLHVVFVGTYLRQLRSRMNNGNERAAIVGRVTSYGGIITVG